jgi:hypothetical protein
MKKYKHIGDINTDGNPEGDMLLTAIAMISCHEGYADKTPDEILRIIHKRTVETLADMLKEWNV